MNKLDDILRRHTLAGQDAAATRGKLTGAAFVVTDQHGPLYSGSSGRLDLDPRSPPWTPHTFAWAASLTKLATTTAVMQLVERRALDLDADVRALVPELQAVRILRGFDDDDDDDGNDGGRGPTPLHDDNTRPITLRQLLTHTSGLSYEFADPVLLRWSRTVPARDVSRMRWSRQEITTPLRFPPGEAWAYGVGLDWAALVLEAATGTSLGRYMQANLFDRVGMPDTGFWPDRLPHTAARTAATTQRARGLGLVPIRRPTTPERHEVESGGAGLFTTAADYARLLRALLRSRSAGEEPRLLSDESLREMLTPQLRRDGQVRALHRVAFHPVAHRTFAPEFEPGQVLNHGLGGMLNVEDVPGKRRGGSMAWSGLPNSRWWLDPKTGIAAVLFVNVHPPGDPVAAALWDELERAVYGELLGERPPRSNM